MTTLKSDVEPGIHEPKSPERLALEKKLKETYGSPEQVRLVLELKEAYESRGIKFYHPWIQGPDYLEAWKNDSKR